MRGGIVRQTDIDRFIRKIQVGSRVTTEGNIIHIEPVRDIITFDMKPSKNNYSDCPVFFCVDISALAICRTSA